MEVLSKNRPVLILSALCVLLFVFNIGSCINSQGKASAYRKEMAQRFDVEEKIAKLSQEKALLTEKLKAQEKESQEDKAALEAAKKALLQEQLVCQTIKDDLQKLTKINESLELKLKESLKTVKRVKK